MLEKLNPIVYGHDDDQGIVAIESWGNNLFKFVQTLGGDTVVEEIRDYKGWYLTHTDFSPNLLGGNHFNKLNRMHSFKEIKKLYEDKESHNDFLLISDKPQMYMIDTGKTLFKDLAFDDVHTMGYDIETTGLDPFYSEIRMISLVDNRGYEKVIYSENEKSIIEEFINIIISKDPTILLGYNNFNFDMNYILARCQVHGIALAIGRNGSEPFEYKVPVRLGVGQQNDVTGYRIFGRHHLDLYYSTMKFDFTDRRLSNYKLKNVIAQYGLEREGRVHMNHDDISRILESKDPQQLQDLMEYNLDDSRDLINLHRHICQAEFYLAQIIPMNYQKLMYAGSVSRINSIMLRDYLNKNESVPTWTEERMIIEGAEVQAEKPGIYKFIGDSDVRSMYPSLMILYDIFPETDTLHTMKNSLVTLRDLRLELKDGLKKESDPVKKASLNGRQLAVKILLNSYFGVLSAQGFYWKDNEKCASVTRHGRELILKIKEFILSEGFSITALDTDGISYTKGEPFDVNYVNDRISGMLPNGIEIETVLYQGIIIFKKKTYATIDENGKITIKGAAVTSSKIPSCIKRFTYMTVKTLFEIAFGKESYDSIKIMYDQLIDDIKHSSLPPSEYSFVNKLNQTVKEYFAKKGTLNENGNTYPSSPVMELIASSGQTFTIGDKVETYHANVLIEKPLTKTQQKKKDTLSLMDSMFQIEEKPTMVNKVMLKLVSDFNNDISFEKYTEMLNKKIEDMFLEVIPREDYFYIFSNMYDDSKHYIYKDYTYRIDPKIFAKWQRITINDEYDLIREQRSDCFTTVLRTNSGENSDQQLLYGPLYFDFDSKDIDEALADAKIVYNFFKNVLNIEQQYIDVWYSGSKGFHIEVNPSVFGVQPMFELNLIYKRIAQYFVDTYSVKTLDMGSIYSMRRMWRLPFSYNSKTGNQKLIVTNIGDVNEFEDLEFSNDIETYINRKREFKKVDVLNKWYSRFVLDHKKQKTATVVKKAEWKYKKLGGKVPACIEFLVKNSISRSGDRNKATMALLSFYKENGVSYEDAVEIVTEWSMNIKKDLTSKHEYGIIKDNVESVANTIYRSERYVFECYFIKGLISDRGFTCSNTCVLKD